MTNDVGFNGLRNVWDPIITKKVAQNGRWKATICNALKVCNYEYSEGIGNRYVFLLDVRLFCLKYMHHWQESQYAFVLIVYRGLSWNHILPAKVSSPMCIVCVFEILTCSVKKTLIIYLFSRGGWKTNESVFHALRLRYTAADFISYRVPQVNRDYSRICLTFRVSGRDLWKILWNET